MVKTYVKNLGSSRHSLQPIHEKSMLLAAQQSFLVATAFFDLLRTGDIIFQPRVDGSNLIASEIHPVGERDEWIWNEQPGFQPMDLLSYSPY